MSIGKPHVEVIPPEINLICNYGCTLPAKFFLGKGRRPCCSSRHNSCNGWKLKTCLSSRNPSLMPEIVAKRNQYFINKFGGTNPLASSDVRAKKSRTCLDRYGGNSPMCSKEVMKKRDDTCQRVYGVDNVRQSVQVEQKIQKTCLRKYGTRFVFQSEIVKGKIVASCRERYGVDNPSQDAEIYEKSLRTRLQAKPYTTPSGEVRYLQGYEFRVLLELLKSGFAEKEVLSGKGNVPKIWYTNPITGRQSCYYPDFYLPRLNWLIEVKSNWTLFGCDDWWLVNKAKRQACLDAGYQFNFVIR